MVAYASLVRKMLCLQNTQGVIGRYVWVSILAPMLLGVIAQQTQSHKLLNKCVAPCMIALQDFRTLSASTLPISAGVVVKGCFMDCFVSALATSLGMVIALPRDAVMSAKRHGSLPLTPYS